MPTAILPADALASLPTRVCGLQRLMSPAFVARWMVATLTALIITGCGSLPPRAEATWSVAQAPLPSSPLVKIAIASTPAGDLTGFRLMPLAAYSLDARLELARRATQSLDIQYYLIQNDLTGRLFLRSMRDAANRGVRVRLLVDDLYTFGADPMFLGIAAFPNVEVRLFNPFCCGRDGLVSKFAASLVEFPRLNHRMHNKLFIADGIMAIAGGRNIADEYFARSLSGNFVDMDALIVGAIIPRLAAIFDVYWNSTHAYPIDQIVQSDLVPSAQQASFNRIVDEGDQMLAVRMPPVDLLGYGPITEDLDAGRLELIWGGAMAFADSPDKVAALTPDEARSMSVTMNVFDLVVAAQSEVVLSSPYFVPGQKGIEAFAALRKQNVAVTVLTNSLASNDEPFVHVGYARYRPALLRAGVRLFELGAKRVLLNKRLELAIPGASLGRLHAKSAVIDRNIVFIGSMNLDPRSDSTNTELGVIVRSPALALEALRVIELSKLHSAYQVQFGIDGYSLEWLSTDENGEVTHYEEPDTSLLQRLQNVLFGPFIPEQVL